MKHLRQRTKTQRANAAILSILTVLSPLQVFGSVLAPIDLEEYFFEVYATAQKPAFSGPVERALKKELKDFVGSGDYNFFSKGMVITSNVREEGSINGNSVYSQNTNLTLTAEKGSVVLSPEAVASGGFGSAVVAGFKSSVQISAGESIVLNRPAHPEDQKDHLSIALGEGSTASLKAKNIIVNGSIGWMGAGAQAALKASESVHIALSEQKRNSVHHPLWVFDSSFIIDAPTVVIDRDVSVTQMGDGYSSFVQIGMDPDLENGIETKDILFNGRVLVGAGTSFKAGSSNSIAFEKTLTIHEGAEAYIGSRHISIDELKFHGNGGLASLAVLPEGSLSFSRPVTVKDGAKLNISLGKNSRLTGAVFTDDQTGSGGSFISLGAGSVWQNAMHSNVTELKVSKGAVIEVGSKKGFHPLQIQQLKGSFATFYLPGGRAGSINLTQGGEGVHSVYLGTSGASITETKLVQHVFSYDDSLPNAGRAKFILANDGLVDAGPYQYKLDLQPVDYGDRRVWLITAEKEEKPTSPVFPPDSNGPSENPDVPPSVPGWCACHSADRPRQLSKPACA